MSKVSIRKPVRPLTRAFDINADARNQRIIQRKRRAIASRLSNIALAISQPQRIDYGQTREYSDSRLEFPI